MKAVIGKVVVLGYQAVGKTSLITRYVQKIYHSNQASTIGASFFTCTVDLEDATTVKLQIWDTSGQERFKAMAPMFYRNSNAAVLVYDITSYSSFEGMQRWVTELKRHVDEPMVLMLVGNKIDLENEREVLVDEAIQYAKKIGAHHYETSAKEDMGIEQVFHNVAVQLVRLAGKEHIESLKVYEVDDDGNILNRSDIDDTIIVLGKVEDVNQSINSIAIGSKVKSRCFCL